MTRNAKHVNGVHTRVVKGVGHAGEMASGLPGQLRERITQQRSNGDAMLKAQLVRTSRELADESSALNAAVASLNGVIKANRRAAARGRTRLFGGLALGAALMYHLDRDHGRERRAATAKMVTSMWRGRGGPVAPAI